MDTFNLVPNTRTRNASHNESFSDGDSITVGRSRTTTNRCRHKWTTEERDELLTIFEAASPHRRGYMVRVHSQWCDSHPELDYMTEQNLRDQIASLRKRMRRSRRRESRRILVDANPSTPTAIQVSPEGRTNHVASRRSDTTTIRDLKEEFLAVVSSVPERSMKHRRIRVQADYVACMNGVLAEYISTKNDLWDVNCAVYAAATVLTPQGLHTSKADKGKSRMQKLDKKVTSCRQEASRLQCAMDALRKGGPFTVKTKRIFKNLRTTHHTLNLSILILLKQKTMDRLRALSLARKKLINRLRWIEENSLFSSNPSRLFSKRNNASKPLLSALDTESFWRDIYEKDTPVQETPILAQFENFCQDRLTDPQECLPVTVDEVKRALARARNFAASGTDGIVNFWWKSFPAVHAVLAQTFTEFIQESKPIPPWLVEGRTVLIPKSGDLSKPKNYRPITCLNTLYKIFTSVLNERVLKSVDPVWSEIYEQRGSKRGLAGCKDNLLIDRCICHDAVHYKRNLSMAWVDYAKAYDSTSHALILRALKTLKVHPNIVRCIGNLMLLWKTKFAVPHSKEVLFTGWVTFQRGIFQGDSLSPLLFCISLLPLSIELRRGGGYLSGPPSRREHKVTHLFYVDDLKLYASNEKELQRTLSKVLNYSTSIGMKFGLDKCAVLHVRRGKGMDDGNDVHLVDGSIIKHLHAEGSYTFLGISERGVQNVTQVKQVLRSKYMARLRQIWRSCLSGKNKVAATNMLAVPLVSYSFGVLRWNVDELKNLDRKTRKMMNINRSLHPKSSVQRIYLPRQQGGRGLLSLEFLHNRNVLGIAQRVLSSQDPLMKLVRCHEFAGKGAFLFKAAARAADIFGLPSLIPDRENSGVPVTQDEHTRIITTIKKAETELLLKDHLSKNLHSVFFKHVRDDGLSPELTFCFLKSAGLKSETEGFVLACQDGVINTLVYQNMITGLVDSTSCRKCHAHPETLMHVLSACPSLAGSSYISRHNAALRVLYYYLRQAYGIDLIPVLPYVPDDIESVVENSKCKIYWNYSFPTSRLLSATKPDITLLDKENKQMFVIELSCPAESNISRKENEKRSKYLDLLSELRKLYPTYKIKLVVLIIGVLGGLKASFSREIESIPICRPNSNSLICRIQKAVLLGSLRIVRALDLV